MCSVGNRLVVLALLMCAGPMAFSQPTVQSTLADSFASDVTDDGEGTTGVFHSADTNVDNAFSISELLGVTQLFTLGEYELCAGGAGDHCCPPLE